MKCAILILTGEKAFEIIVRNNNQILFNCVKGLNKCIWSWRSLIKFNWKKVQRILFIDWKHFQTIFKAKSDTQDRLWKDRNWENRVWKDQMTSLNVTCSTRVKITNILRADLMRAQIPKAQKDWCLDCLFVLLEYVSKEAACKILVKSTPCVNFTNSIGTAYPYWSVFWSFFLFCLQFGFLTFYQKNIGKKGACKMLVKLTTFVNFSNSLRAAFLL